ncbi:P-loop NTPase fold protein [uncultured Porphyromonas sp.]|mgnify:CR=1 FL=1|uniref:P-loop NTPase fold protein n=1 Tax=uncultured Porphyromonas sp. TaxID=159274 RepID=UPI00258415FF|nr:P-loop NTPase fold protein [uncultured Porphyromonas sp.]
MDATTTVDLWPKFKQHFFGALGLSVQQLFSYLFVVTLIGIVYIHVQELLFPLLDHVYQFLKSKELMPWFGTMIVLIVLYQLYWIWTHRSSYLLTGIYYVGVLFFVLYVYYRGYYSSCYFWPITEGGEIAWVDLFLLPYLLCVVQQGVYIVTFLPKWRASLRRSRVQGIETDRPIKSEDEDWLGFCGVVGILSDSLKSLDLRRESLTMGIVAQWGKGKTSFVNLLAKKVKEHGDIVVCFNPRASKSVAHIQEDFFDAFSKELSKYCSGFGFLLGRYTKHLGLLGQYEWTRPLESLLTLLLPEKDEQAINDALRIIGRRVYVIIDDLDRLTGEEIIEVLKLVDRNASFNNVVFVMAYDKEYVNNVLSKHLSHGLDHSFIDKYVTWEVILPEMDSEVLKEKMREYWKVHLLWLPEEEQKRVLQGWSYVEKIIAEDLASVRHLKRYVNLTLHRYKEVYSKVDPADFFLLSLLQYRHLTIYNNLAQCAGALKVLTRGLSDQIQSILGENYPEARLLIRKMFIDRPVGREEISDPLRFGELKLIRSEEAFPYYFRYMKDKTEEK